MLNCRPPSGNQLVFISKNGNSSFVTTWTLYYFTWRRRFVSVVHISTVNWRCWLPSALSNVCWNSAIQSLSLVRFSFSWIILVSHLDICRGRLSGLEETWIFQKGKTQPVQLGNPIHIHQLLTLVLLFCSHGTCITLRQKRLGSSSFLSGWSAGIYLRFIGFSGSFSYEEPHSLFIVDIPMKGTRW